nr:hypothetical protein [uncultured bacterium]
MILEQSRYLQFCAQRGPHSVGIRWPHSVVAGKLCFVRRCAKVWPRREAAGPGRGGMLAQVLGRGWHAAHDG